MLIKFWDITNILLLFSELTENPFQFQIIKKCH